MSDLLTDIAAYLIEEDLAEGDGVDIFRDIMPPNPDNVVTIYEYQGSGSRPGVEAVGRSVQVCVRDTNQENARVKIWSIYNFLFTPEDEIHEDINGRWGILHARGTPFKLKVDTLNRTYFVFNLSVITSRN